MTAQRWWVRLAARWLARLDGVAGQLRLAMLGLTGLSTGVVALRDYGLSEYALPLVATVALGTIAYTYLYTEGGVWNQMSRDRHDLSTNYSEPNHRFLGEFIARAQLAATKGEPLDETEREAVREELEAAFAEYRDGIDLDED